jgi:hypothetical protein
MSTELCLDVCVCSCVCVLVCVLVCVCVLVYSAAKRCCPAVHIKGGGIMSSDFGTVDISCVQPNQVLLFKCRQATCNVTLRRVRVTVFVVESNKYYL